jgi:small subunit ribosomal protein S10
MAQKVRIKLKSFDHILVDQSAEKIVKTVKSSGAIVSGPIPLPTHKKNYSLYCVLHTLIKKRENNFS